MEAVPRKFFLSIFVFYNVKIDYHWNLIESLYETFLNEKNETTSKIGNYVEEVVNYSEKGTFLFYTVCDEYFFRGL